MGSFVVSDKPHAVCIPFPAQGHINPMLKVAKLLHYRGSHITFVNTDFNHKQLLKSGGLNALDGLPDFRFETIPDGLPPPDAISFQDIPSLCYSTSKNCLEPFSNLLAKLNNSSSSHVPPVTCIVSDGIMSFTIEAAEKFGIPEVLFWTTSACGFLAYTQFKQLTERGFNLLKDETCLIDGYLDTVIDWIPGMKNIRLKDLPCLVTTTDSKENMVDFFMSEVEKASRASAVILNTFDAFEKDAVEALSAMFPCIYTVGPLNMLIDQISDDRMKSIGSNLWKEQSESIEWLDSKEPNSVVYVNFGSVAVMTHQQLIEFAWGLANSKKPFLWIIRSDIVTGDSAMLPPEFLTETKERRMLVSWCPQEQVLKHPSVGGFLTHSGWNSTIESICGGVPVICWPFIADQHTNCHYSCTEWGIGMEIDSDVKRDEVEKQVKELIDGEKGKEMKRMAVEWKNKAEEATAPAGGSSFLNLDKLVVEKLL